MIRYRLFGRCRIYHDPVSPVMKSPANIGWSAFYREIDLVTPRRLKGPELLARTKGWWTTDPGEIGPVVQEHGRLVVGPGGELMVEFQDQEQARALAAALEEKFGGQVFLAP